MTRSAEHSIAGYVYQASKCLVELLQSKPGDRVAIEGLIEDIDHYGAAGVRAIQCKYHAQKADYQLSYVYKPVLQMWAHYSANQNSDIRYVLYAHFPSMSGTQVLSKVEFDKILSTRDASLIKIIEKITEPGEKAKFLEKFTIEFGPSLDELTDTAIQLLVGLGFSKDDADSFFLPASIHSIIEHAIQVAPEARTIEKNEFVAKLRNLRSDAVYRWTKELKTKKKIYDRARQSLRDRLSQGTRKRVIIINSQQLEDFECGIVPFVRDFVGKYFAKPHIHINAPTILLDDVCNMDDIEERLFRSGIKIHTGKVGARYDVDRFCDDAIWDKGKGVCSYNIRMTRASYVRGFDGRLRPDDIFTVHSSFNPTNPDVNNIRLDVPSFADLAYIFSIGGFSG